MGGADLKLYPANVYTRDPGGYDLPFIRVEPGSSWFTVRFVSEIVPLLLHFDEEHWSPCYFDKCKLCCNHTAALYGYADVVVNCPIGKQGEPIVHRAILSMNATAVNGLKGMFLRGKLVRFRKKTKKSATQFEIDQKPCPFRMPSACNVKAVLMRKYGFRQWPVEPATIRIFQHGS